MLNAVGTMPQIFQHDPIFTPAPLHVCIDLETVSGDPDDAYRWARDHWSPSDRWKPETIGQRFLEALAKQKERLNLMDGSPVISIGIGTERELRLFHWLDCHVATIGTATVERHANEGSMLLAVRDWLARCDRETVLTGHNVRGFDLRKLRHRMITHGIKPPPCLLDRSQPVFDSMLEWKRYTLNDGDFVGLSEILDALGIPNHKQAISGDMVEELHQVRQFEKLLTYAVLDVVAEYQVFCRLAGIIGK